MILVDGRSEDKTIQIINDYIKTYKSIEPDSEVSLLSFFEELLSKTNNDLYISSGNIPNKFISYFKSNFLNVDKNIYEYKFLNNKIVFFDNLNFLQLEKLILQANTLITCHGAPTHVAGSFNKNIIDIIF